MTRDEQRTRLQHLQHLMRTKHTASHADYWAWHKEAEELMEELSKPIAPPPTGPCEGPRGYPPVDASKRRVWQRPEHVNPVPAVRLRWR